MTIGLYFGSFNPIHTGHLVIAQHMVSHHGLDEVWFVVTPHNPMKQATDLAPEADRLEMVQLALADNPRLKAQDVEFGLPRPNYTAHTMDFLAKRHPDKTFRIIIDAILIHLFGMPYSTISKTTMDFKATKGLWGNARAYVAVIEATGTGLLHAHVLLWSFLHVALIRKMLADEAKRNEITAFIDKTVSAKFDHLVHAKYE